MQRPIESISTYFPDRFAGVNPGSVLDGTGIPEKKVQYINTKILRELLEISLSIDLHVIGLNGLIVMFTVLNLFASQWDLVLHHLYGLKLLNLSQESVNLTFVNTEGKTLDSLTMECYTQFLESALKVASLNELQSCLHCAMIVINLRWIKRLGIVEIFVLLIIALYAGVNIPMFHNCNPIGFMPLTVWLLINMAELIIITCYSGYIIKLQKKRDKCVFIAEITEADRCV